MLRSLLLPLAFLTLGVNLPAQRLEPVPGLTPTGIVEHLVYMRHRGMTVGFSMDAETWIHDGSQWKNLKTTVAPSKRYEFGMAFDGTRVLLYGGQDAAGGVLSDFWAFNGVNWTLISKTSAPGLRRGHALAFDQSRKRLVLYGGTDMQMEPADTWEWDGKTWTKSNGFGPGGRVWHSMEYDPNRKKILLVGGAENPVIFTDTWEWDGKAWTQVLVTTAPARLRGALVYDPFTQRMLLIGGQRPNGGGANIEAYEPLKGAWLPIQLVGSYRKYIEDQVGAAYDERHARIVIAHTRDSYSRNYSHYYYDGGTGTYSRFGSGCGTHEPTLTAAPGSRPFRGSQFDLVIENPVGAQLAVLITGISNTKWGAIPLPLALQGLPGCNLYVSPDIFVPKAVDPKTGTAKISMPLSGLLPTGLTFYQQAMALVTQPKPLFGGLSYGTQFVLR